MIPADVLFVFIAASTALALAPGPDNIFVLTQAALGGRFAGLMVTLGLVTGVLVHTVLVALGVAVIFQTSQAAFTLLKLAGAGYLLWLAWKSLRAGAADLQDGSPAQLPAGRLYARGVIMNLTNPKVAIFFLAFLPQFADPGRGPVTAQIFVFGAVFGLCALVIFGAVAWTAGFLGGWLRSSPRAQIVLNRVAGAVFAGLALRLLMAER
ncbi:LysE family translocator [uncultured Roseobacter sp.]|uniref:LysE family translocator n=1 Tax=uncultured Roseobacter sp. TaxID=114847 RepID=UPI002639A148|nr:LysE family translocator [uncultured Roseobacter sp.]